jgi:hypothetical protein
LFISKGLMTKKSIEISLEPSDEEEIFEINDENLANVCIFAPDGDKAKVLKGSQYHVILELSPDGMIGLATELLRTAFNNEEDVFIELMPSERGFISQCMGIVLKPDSCRLSISKQVLGKIEDIE